MNRMSDDDFEKLVVTLDQKLEDAANITHRILEFAFFGAPPFYSQFMISLHQHYPVPPTVTPHPPLS